MQINQTSTARSTSTGSTANSGSSTGATAAGATTSDQMAKLSSNYTTFLKLLTSQMKYQDPMQPMDSSQFTSQLVQYSQVEQQISTNDKLDKLVSAQNSNQIQ